MFDRARVVCLDTVMIDFTLIVTALPEPGGDSLSSQRLVTAGGGYNVMSAARRQGIDAVYVGQLGTGPFADIARGILVGDDIDIAVEPRGGMDLGVCVVLVDDSGERSFVTSPGAELTLRGDDLLSLTLGADDVVYLSGYNVVYPEVAAAVSEWLRDVPADVVVAFDPGPRAADIRPSIMALVLERTDWLLCNASEAHLLSGEVDASSGARQLRERGSYDLVVVRDGARGCVGASGEGVIVAPGFDSHVVDTNGAGDVHNGVVIAELSRGTVLGEALLRANAAAALAIEILGPATCPIRDVVDALLLEQPRAVTQL